MILITLSIDKLNNYNKPLQTFTRNSIIDNEIESYLEEPCVTFSKLLISCKFWKSRTEFPILKNLARKFLAVPASTCTVERIFSDLGNIMTVKRCQMDADTLKVLGYLYHNYESINFNV